MIEFLTQTFSRDLVPHGYCIQWRPGLLWLHALSDGLIALSYCAIPLGLYRVVRARNDLPFPRLFQLFAAFILACGTTHLLSIWTIWQPDYALEGLAKAVTAGVSLVAAVVFIRSSPRMLGLPSMRELEDRVAEQTSKLTAANDYLRRQIAQGEEAERTLAERESRLRSIVDTAVNAILTIDEFGTVESLNPAAVRLFGYAPSEVLGRNVSMLMDSPDREQHDQYLRSYCETGVRRIIGIGREVAGRRKDGTQIPLELGVSEFESARGRRFTGILTDISERKKVEERLAQSVDELEEANRALQERNQDLDDFAHTVSHDLKEPLRGIQTYCWTLSEDHGAELPETVRGPLERIHQLAERLHGMIDAVLEYSRLGRETFARTMDLNDLLQEARDMLYMTLRERGCTVRVPQPLPNVECDPTMTAEIFKNLLSNASKYNDKEEKLVDVGWAPNAGGRGVKIFVRDNGIGIDPSQHERVFRVFHRLNQGGDPGEGAGAGLAIVKKLVERQGGRVWVESTPGEGSTFCFTLGSAAYAPDGGVQ